MYYRQKRIISCHQRRWFGCLQTTT
ncbi:BnaA05g37360D [Brassica napus]|uniref:BnaA05g37360D protein n=1 Tax=Brassica napus TaxID=3708 RepID=A0A078IIK3_BRANA|nr:BnaA05g37360D [Brassica napus]